MHGNLQAMKLESFALERYFAKYEFSAPHLLSSSDCDGWPLDEILALADCQTLDLWQHLRLGYTESQGHPLLRQEIAGLYQSVQPEQVLVATPEEGIFIAMHCLLEKGDHVICTFPGYQSLYQVAEGLGCEITRWYPEEKQGWRFDPEFLRENIKKTTRLIVWNFPHNPTGFLPSQADFQTMLAIASEHGVWVFADEMYRLLENEPADRLPSAVDCNIRTVALFGMSKSFGLPGLRIGWLATKDKDLYARLAGFKDYTTICSSAPSEVLALIALRAKEQILERHRQRVRNHLALLDEFFERRKGWFGWVRPRGGTVCFPRLLREESTRELAERAVTQAGIMLAPSQVFDYGDRHFRLGFGRQNLPEVLERFEEFLAETS